MNNFLQFISRLECNDKHKATASIHFSRGEFKLHCNKSTQRAQINKKTHKYGIVNARVDERE